MQKGSSHMQSGEFNKQYLKHLKIQQLSDLGNKPNAKN